MWFAIFSEIGNFESQFSVFSRMRSLVSYPSRYLVIKTLNTQMSFKTQSELQNSLFHPFHFNNSNFTAIFKVLFLIHYPLENHFKGGYIFSVFYSGSAFSRNLVGFKSQNFYSLSWATMGGVLSVTNQNK